MTFEQWWAGWKQACRADRCEMDVESAARAAFEAGVEAGFDRADEARYLDGR